METTRDISAEELAALRDPGARRGAFDRLVGAYLRPLYWHARRLVVVHEDAEDVVQETLRPGIRQDRHSSGAGATRWGHGSTASPRTRP